MSLALVDRGVLEGLSTDRNDGPKIAMYPKEVLSSSFMTAFRNIRTLDLRTVPRYMLQNDQELEGNEEDDRASVLGARRSDPVCS